MTFAVDWVLIKNQLPIYLCISKVTRIEMFRWYLTGLFLTTEEIVFGAVSVLNSSNLYSFTWNSGEIICQCSSS